MAVKFDYTKSWKELSTEEQAAWDSKCQKAQTKLYTKLRINEPAELVDSIHEWNLKHVTTMRKVISTEGKIALKKAASVEEYNLIFAEYAKKLEAVGF